jgi:hypothetical protein
MFIFYRKGTKKGPANHEKNAHVMKKAHELHEFHEKKDVHNILPRGVNQVRSMSYTD